MSRPRLVCEAQIGLREIAADDADPHFERLGGRRFEQARSAQAFAQSFASGGRVRRSNKDGVVRAGLFQQTLQQKWTEKAGAASQQYVLDGLPRRRGQAEGSDSAELRISPHRDAVGSLALLLEPQERALQFGDRRNVISVEPFDEGGEIGDGQTLQECGVEGLAELRPRAFLDDRLQADQKFDDRQRIESGLGKGSTVVRA